MNFTKSVSHVISFFSLSILMLPKPFAETEDPVGNMSQHPKSLDGERCSLFGFFFCPCSYYPNNIMLLESKR